MKALHPKCTVSFGQKHLVSVLLKPCMSQFALFQKMEKKHRTFKLITYCVVKVDHSF